MLRTSDYCPINTLQHKIKENLEFFELGLKILVVHTKDVLTLHPTAKKIGLNQIEFKSD